MFPTDISGGDIVRAGWATKRVGSGAKIITSVVAERLLGALALSIVACGSFLVISLGFGVPPAVFVNIILVLSFGSLLGLSVFFNQTVHEIIWRATLLVRWRWANSLIAKLTAATQAFKEAPAVVIAFLVLSIVEQLFPIINGYLLAKSLSIDLSITWIVLGMPLIVAISRMPVSLDGIGVAEGAYAFIFSFAGVPLTASVMMALTGRLLLLLSALPGAFWMGFSKDTALQPAFTGSLSPVIRDQLRHPSQRWAG